MKETMIKDKKGNLRSNKAITLIALVVTIVVLLILAGVSINMVFGQNGLIKKAKEAKTAYQEAEKNDVNAIESLSESIDELTLPNSTIDGKEITKENLAEHLGKAVNYVPGTVEHTYGISTTYRLFYVDFDGKFGEKGSVYLKADCDVNNKALPIIAEYTTLADKPENKIFELNPKMKEVRKNDKAITQDNDKAVMWMTDTNNWKDWIDTTTEGIKGNVNYVVGGPSYEMFRASYDLKNPGNPNNVFNYRGSLIKGYVGEENIIKNVPEQNNMYHPGLYNTYWLASPSGNDPTGVLSMHGNESTLTNYGYGTTNCICPLVSLKPGVQLTTIR